MTPGRALDQLIWQHVFAPPGSRLRGLPKPYSTDIAAAWEVVEKLKGNASVQRAGQRWWASFGEHEEEASTAPHAICLAALKASGVVVDS